MSYTQFQYPKKDIFLIDMRAELSKPFSEIVQKWIAKYISQWKKIAIIVNKKWYATGTVCKECGYIPRCTHCDVPIGYHLDAQGGYTWLCHICKRHYPNTPTCPQCGWHDTKMYGLWSQQVAQRIEDTYRIIPLLIESEKVNSPSKIKKITTSLATAQIVVGTTLLSQPPQGVRFDLLIVVQADSRLNIPDYQSSRQTFTFLYETFSNHHDATFLIQSYNPEHAAVQSACKLDLEGMRKSELEMRKQFGYPPVLEMCVLLYKHEIEERLYGSVNKLYQELLFLKENYAMSDLEITTTPPLIYKMFGKYRYNIILKGSNLRQFMDIAYSKLKMPSRGFKIDREPMGIL